MSSIHQRREGESSQQHSSNAGSNSHQPYFDSTKMMERMNSFYAPIQMYFDAHPHLFSFLRFFWFNIFHLPSPIWATWFYHFINDNQADLKHLHYKPQTEGGWIRTPSRTVNAALWVWYKYFAPERLDVEGMSEEQKKESEQRHKQASAKKWRKRKHMFIAAISFIAFSAFAIFIGILTLIFWPLAVVVVVFSAFMGLKVLHFYRGLSKTYKSFSSQQSVQSGS